MGASPPGPRRVSPGGVPVPDAIRWSHLVWVACYSVVAFGAVTAMAALPADLGEMTDGSALDRLFTGVSLYFSYADCATQLALAVVAMWIARRMRDGQGWARVALTIGALLLFAGGGSPELTSTWSAGARQLFGGFEDGLWVLQMACAAVATVLMWSTRASAFLAAHRPRVGPAPGPQAPPPPVAGPRAPSPWGPVPPSPSTPGPSDEQWMPPHRRGGRH